jgi:hypothetical protein
MTHWGTVLHRVQRASQLEPGRVRTGTGRACSRGDMIELARQKSGEGITSHVVARSRPARKEWDETKAAETDRRRKQKQQAARPKNVRVAAANLNEKFGLDPARARGRSWRGNESAELGARTRRSWLGINERERQRKSENGTAD